MENNSFYTVDDLNSFGFKSIGTNVLISKKSSIYSPEKISIGSNVRIDDFCILSGNIQLADFVHIAAGVKMFGGNSRIFVGDFCGISSGSIVYANVDDFSGDYLIGPMVTEKYRNVTSKEVVFRKHVQVGAASVILPGVILDVGVVIGANSLVKDNLSAWGIYAGSPVKRLKSRKRNLLEKEEEFLTEFNKGTND